MWKAQRGGPLPRVTQQKQPLVYVSKVLTRKLPVSVTRTQTPHMARPLPPSPPTTWPFLGFHICFNHAGLPLGLCTDYSLYLRCSLQAFFMAGSLSFRGPPLKYQLLIKSFLDHTMEEGRFISSPCSLISPLAPITSYVSLPVCLSSKVQTKFVLFIALSQETSQRLAYTLGIK